MVKKGNIPWNKGLTKELDIRVVINAEGISKSLKGKNNPNFNPYKNTLTYKLEKLKKRREYETKYRNNNRLFIQEINRRSYKKNREKVIERKKAWRKKTGYSKKHYAKNKMIMLKKSKEYTKDLRIKAISVYSNEKNICVCCNENNFEFLTIDHLPDAPHKRDKNKKKGGGEIYYWLKKHNYPKGFRVLCMNCNFSYGKYGYCPHNKKEETNDAIPNKS